MFIFTLSFIDHDDNRNNNLFYSIYLKLSEDVFVVLCVYVMMHF